MAAAPVPPSNVFKMTGELRASPVCVDTDTPPSEPVTLHLKTREASGSIAGSQQSALLVKEHWLADQHCH